MSTKLSYTLGDKEQSFEVKENPSKKDGVVTINYPGIGGDIDGYNHKYRKLAEHVAESFGLVLQISGPEHHADGGIYDLGVVAKLRAVIDYVLQNSEKLSGTSRDEIELNLIGYSAGGGAAAAVSGRYDQISKILLLAPGPDAGKEQITAGLEDYQGELYGVVGEQDEVVGQEPLNRFIEVATLASKVRTQIIPNCNHQFMGTPNGKIMSAAPIWAFAKKGEGKINPHDGIELY